MSIMTGVIKKVETNHVSHWRRESRSGLVYSNPAHVSVWALVEAGSHTYKVFVGKRSGRCGQSPERQEKRVLNEVKPILLGMEISFSFSKRKGIGFALDTTEGKLKDLNLE